MGHDHSGEHDGQPRYRHDDPITDEALDWVMRLQEGAVDPATRAAFEAWRRSDPRRDRAFKDLERMQAMPSLRQASLENAGPATPPIRHQPRLARSHSVARRPWIRRAAAMAAGLVLALAIYQAPEMLLRWQADYLTETGEQQEIRLPDGSTMMLNTASAAAIDFENGRRHVRLLRGEAYFDVRHDETHPFTVSGAYSDTHDLGTVFLVRRDNGKDTVILREGLIAVRRLEGEGRNVTLQPGQEIDATEQRLSAVSAANLDQSFAWTDGLLIFRNEKFATALQELERYFSGKVIVAESKLNRVTVSGNYRIDDPEAAIRTLAEAAGANVTRLPGLIILQ